MKIIKLSCLSLFLSTHVWANKMLIDVIKKSKNPLSYDLGIKIIPSKVNDSKIMICCHGYGHNNKIADVINSYKVVKDNLVSFNFPDFNITDESDHNKSCFGSINEILPLLYVIKLCVIEGKQSTINLYGFSAGGGAIINLLAILNQDTFDKKLQEIGINSAEKRLIIDALQAGNIILDCPLKSMDEIIAFRGDWIGFKIVAQRYVINNMRPIDNIKKLAGLKLNILLHFQNPDEILSNRDDELFIDELKKVNKNTKVVIASEGGHNVFHKKLWEAYRCF